MEESKSFRAISANRPRLESDSKTNSNMTDFAKQFFNTIPVFNGMLCNAILCNAIRSHPIQTCLMAPKSGRLQACNDGYNGRGCIKYIHQLQLDLMHKTNDEMIKNNDHDNGRS